MNAYVKVRKTLTSKAKGKGKSSSKISKASSPPQSSADKELEARFAAQYSKLSSDLDSKFSHLSDSLINQVSVLISHNIRQQTSSDPPGDSVSHTDPEPTATPDNHACRNAAEVGVLGWLLGIKSLAPK